MSEITAICTAVNFRDDITNRKLTVLCAYLISRVEAQGNN